MFSNWAAIIICWPSVIAALAMFIVAVAINSRALGMAAAAVSAPFCLWVSGYPVVRGLGYVALAANVAGIVALSRGQRFAAAMLWAPFAMLAGGLALLIFGHHI